LRIKSSNCNNNVKIISENIPVTTILPGHGPVLSKSALEKVEEYISHRDSRENQIIYHLEKTTLGSWCTSWDIVSAIYPSSLSFITKLSAQNNVLHHLTKLQLEDRVETKWPDLWRCKIIK
jgi:hypothetical protein